VENFVHKYVILVDPLVDYGKECPVNGKLETEWKN